MELTKQLIEEFKFAGHAEFYLESIAGQCVDMGWKDSFSKQILRDIATIANLYDNRVNALRVLDNAMAQYLTMQKRGSKLSTFGYLKEYLVARTTRKQPMTEVHLKRTIDDFLLDIKTDAPHDSREYVGEKRSDIQYRQGLKE